MWWKCDSFFVKRSSFLKLINNWKWPQDLSEALLNSNVCEICPKSNSGASRKIFGPSSRNRSGISFEIGGGRDDDEEEPSAASKAKDSLKFESEILLASGPRDIEVAGSPIPRGHLVQVLMEKMKCLALLLNLNPQPFLQCFANTNMVQKYCLIYKWLC